MPIQTQVWTRDIKEKLFPENSFVVRGINDDAWVDNKTVNLAEAGALPEVVRDRSSLPATRTQRTDSSPNYDLHEHTTTPTVIRDIEETETNYNKRQSVVGSHSKSLNNDIANWIAYYWGATQSANIIRTSGTNRAAVVAGATGTRAQLVLDNIFDAKALMDDMDLDEEGRCILLPAYMYNDLIKSKQELLEIELSGNARIENGIIKNILGFEIYKRGKKNLLTYSNAATPVKREPTAANLTTANAAAIFWHEEFVRRALGAVKVFSEIDDPSWYASTFSTLARAGGRPAYSDETGIGAIVEAAGA